LLKSLKVIFNDREEKKMSTVSLEAYIKYASGDEERVYARKISTDEIEDEVVELCANYNFDDTLAKSDDGASGALTFEAVDDKKKRSLTLVLKGKREVLEELEDRGIFQD
jgi:hypothetical protein